MKITKLNLITNPSLLMAKLKGLHPFYYQSALLAKKYGGNVKTIIDVGASVGDYSKACKSVFPKAEIHAFEPNPKALNSLKNKRFLKIYDYALTNKNGVFSFNFDEKWDSTSSLLDYGKNNRRFGADINKIKVKGKRFDALNIELKRPCFVKIEVEGAEQRVLEGFGEKLKNVDVLNVAFEFKDTFVGKTKLSEIALLTEKAGFKNFIQTYFNEKNGCEFYFFKN